MQSRSQAAHSLQSTAHAVGILNQGQTIQISKHLVQVERYLSQGGYAHVYVVTTKDLVNGTNRHVLKRIAVPDAAMLKEVQKEVDIMRNLNGHPNIVHFIDASWNQLHDGTYEIFILMEFCAGGGIIDMMNRRLRERLTEDEILQIFVDVCEAVAAMHNLKPALLHRDLKVENILQASAMCFKLCDFGSATTVASRPVSSVGEIRLLEADLNRHTTMQYRAPEMVDVYLRRRIDEKSDVWALGVLLYKLCYYTTPFEEHGPLAILNVQYKIPGFPVYSQRMNKLIHSMLQEHGSQRPSVFTLLDEVHAMRGSKSSFRYTQVEAAPTLETKLVPPAKREHARPDQSKSLESFATLAASTSPNNVVHQGSRALPQIPLTSSTTNQTLKSSSTDNTWIPRPSSTYQSKDLVGGAFNAKQSPADSFGESFGATRPKATGTSGFEDSFVPQIPTKVVPRASQWKPPELTSRDAFSGLDRLAVPTTSTGSSSSSGKQSRIRSPVGVNLLTAPSAPSLPHNSFKSPSPSAKEPELLSAEERYPALEDLEPRTGFVSIAGGLGDRRSPMTEPIAPTPSKLLSVNSVAQDGSRSQQVTGTAMLPSSQSVSLVSPIDSFQPTLGAHGLRPTRPALPRKHRSSTNIRSPTHESAPWQQSTAVKEPKAQISGSQWPNSSGGHKHDITLALKSPSLSQPDPILQNTTIDSKTHRSALVDSSRLSPSKAYTALSPTSSTSRKGGASSDEDSPEDPTSAFSKHPAPGGERPAKGRKTSVHNIASFYDRPTRGNSEQASKPGLPHSINSNQEPTLNSTHGKSRAPPSLGPSTSASRIARSRTNVGAISSHQDGKSKQRPQSLLVTSSSYKVETKTTSPTSGARSKAMSRGSSRRNSISDIVDKYESRASQDTGIPSPRSPSHGLMLESANIRTQPDFLGNQTTTRSRAPKDLGSLYPLSSNAGLVTEAVGAKAQQLPRGSQAAVPLSTAKDIGTSVGDFTADAQSTGPQTRVQSILQTNPNINAKSPISKASLQSPSTTVDPHVEPQPPQIAPKPISAANPPPRSLASLLSADTSSESKVVTPRPESPERPFQGVGKLIKQWQQLTQDRR